MLGNVVCAEKCRQKTTACYPSTCGTGFRVGFVVFRTPRRPTVICGVVALRKSFFPPRTLRGIGEAVRLIRRDSWLNLTPLIGSRTPDDDRVPVELCLTGVHENKCSYHALSPLGRFVQKIVRRIRALETHRLYAYIRVYPISLRARVRYSEPLT